MYCRWIEKDYEYEHFVKEIGENMKLTPQLSKYVYNLSLECSQEVKRKAKKEQGETPPVRGQSI